MISQRKIKSNLPMSHTIFHMFLFFQVWLTIFIHNCTAGKDPVFDNELSLIIQIHT